MLIYWGAAVAFVLLIVYVGLGTLDGSMPHSPEVKRQIHVIR